MNDAWKRASLVGFVTSIGTAYAVSLVAVLTGLDAQRFALFLFVPVGALACAMVAISGFYRAAVRNEALVTPAMLGLMLTGSLLAEILIYWFEYMGAFVPGQSFASVASFSHYLDASLTMSEVAMRGMSEQAGQLGYARLVAFAIVPIVAWKQLPRDRSFLDR